MGRGLVIGVVALAAGLAIGIAIGLALQEPAAATAPGARSESAVSADGAPPPASAAAERRRADASSVPPRTEEVVRRLLAASEDTAQPAPDASSAPAGDGVITGLVRQPDGSPAPGILFVLTQQFPSTPSAGGPQVLPERLPPIEERLKKALERERWIDATRRTATSGADGRFSFTGVPDDVHTVQGSADGWQISADARSWKCSPGDDLRFTATRTGKIRVRVVEPGGAAPSSAKIWLQSGARTESRAWTRDETGPQAFVAGKYKARAEAGKLGELSCEPVDVEIANDKDNADLVLTLASRPGVGGRVRFDANAWGPQSNATVYVVRVEGEETPSIETFQRDGRQTQVQLWDQGTYSVNNLLPGRYAIGLSLMGMRDPIGTWTVDVGNAFVVRDLDPGPPDRARFVEVTVLDTDGRPLREGVQFGTAERSKNRSSSNGGAATITRADGARWVLAAAPQPDADTHYFIRVSHPDYGAREAEYKPGPSAAVEVRFAPPASLDVTVEGWTAHPQRDLFSLGLRLADIDARNRGGGSESNATPDATGRARMGPVPPGDYEVVIWLKRGRGGTNGVGNFPVTLAAGSNATTVQVPALHTLIVDVGRDRAGRRVRFGRSRPGEDEAVADASGRALLSRLLAGDVTLQLDGERETKSVRVPDVSIFVW